ncbi:hypothetical protein C1C97_011705 [Kocuria tytonis]|uniref:Uncharacterized protein n=1 Tax=Kocuria tytonis TaxID=2054280 RepID=A0A495A1N5_9MICC|nr:hypothetical protein C1C97_011705 [Kocuria tytonis]
MLRMLLLAPSPSLRPKDILDDGFRLLRFPPVRGFHARRRCDPAEPGTTVPGADGLLAAGPGPRSHAKADVA